MNPRLFDTYTRGVRDFEPLRAGEVGMHGCGPTQRQQARQERRWRDADTLRQEIRAAGFDVEDGPQGPRIQRLNA